MKNYSKEEMEEGLDHYCPETRVFPKIAKAEGPPKLTKQDVLLILKWKLGRIKESNSETVSKDNLRKINQWVEMAGKASREIEALKELDKIPGIGLATATAILTVCYPDKFTILDYRVLDTLGLTPSNANDWKAEEYFHKYLPEVQKHREHWHCSLRQADRALWGLSVKKQIE